MSASCTPGSDLCAFGGFPPLALSGRVSWSEETGTEINTFCGGGGNSEEKSSFISRGSFLAMTTKTRDFFRRSGGLTWTSRCLRWWRARSCRSWRSSCRFPDRDTQWRGRCGILPGRNQERPVPDQNPQHRRWCAVMRGRKNRKNLMLRYRLKLKAKSWIDDVYINLSFLFFLHLIFYSSDAASSSDCSFYKIFVLFFNVCSVVSL